MRVTNVVVSKNTINAQREMSSKAWTTRKEQWQKMRLESRS
jgi:hypothetical protein